MNFSKTFLLGAAVALACGTAVAADKHHVKDNEPGFNALDRNNDGYISRAEAVKDGDLLKNFSKADKDHDGKLSRAEYLSVKAKKDANTVSNKVSRGADKVENKVRHATRDAKQDASTGSSTGSRDVTGKPADKP